MWFLRACCYTQSVANAPHLYSRVPSLNGCLRGRIVVTLRRCSAISYLHDFSLARARLFRFYSVCSRQHATETNELPSVKEYVKPSSRMFISLFKACGSIKDLQKGIKLHEDASNNGFMDDFCVGNTVLRMYGKCGAISKAEDVFCNMPKRTIVSWNAMLSVYIQECQGEKVFRAYQQMEEEGLNPDVWTFVFTIRACGSLHRSRDTWPLDKWWIKKASFEIGQAYHSLVLRKGLARNPLVGNALMSLYGRCGAVVEASMTFDALSMRGVVSWTAMLSTYIENDQEEMALLCYNQMHGEGVAPDTVACIIALQGCSNIAEKEEAMILNERSIKFKAFKIGQALHRDACSLDIASDTCVGTSIICMYSKCGAIAEAEETFLKLPYRDIVSWNAMFSAYLEQGNGEKVLWLYTQMQEQKLTMDEVTLYYALHACSEHGSLEFCEELNFNMVCMKLGKPFSLLATLIYAYGSRGSILCAEASFEEIVHPDLVSWSVLLYGHAGEGNDIIVLQLFERLTMASITPDNGIFTSVLTACNHAGLVLEGLECFKSIRRDYYMSPKLMHYGVMTDLFSRIGDFKKVSNMLSKMPMQPDLAIWWFILGACQTHGNIELAEQAFAHAVRLQPKQATAYILMSYIYGSANLPDCVKEIENLRHKNGIHWLEPD